MSWLKIHRKSVINLDYVKQITIDATGAVIVMNDGEKQVLTEDNFDSVEEFTQNQKRLVKDVQDMIFFI